MFVVFHTAGPGSERAPAGRAYKLSGKIKDRGRVQNCRTVHRSAPYRLSSIPLILSCYDEILKKRVPVITEPYQPTNSVRNISSVQSVSKSVASLGAGGRPPRVTPSKILWANLQRIVEKRGRTGLRL